MSKFNIGDKVRVIKLDEDDLEVGIEIGNTGTILYADDFDNVPTVRVDGYNKKLEDVDESCEWSFYDYQLELVEEQSELDREVQPETAKEETRVVEKQKDLNKDMLESGMIVEMDNKKRYIVFKGEYDSRNGFQTDKQEIMFCTFDHCILGSIYNHNLSPKNKYSAKIEKVFRLTDVVQLDLMMTTEEKLELLWERNREEEKIKNEIRNEIKKLKQRLEELEDKLN